MTRGWRYGAALGGCAAAALLVQPLTELARAAAPVQRKGPVAGTADTELGNRLLERLRQAKGGETIQLAAGDYGRLILPSRQFTPAVTLNAAAARFSGIVIRDGGGVAVKGGTIVGPGRGSYGVTVQESRDVAIDGMRIRGAHRGIVVGGSEGVRLENNQLVGVIAEGINVALSRQIVIRGNRCAEFTPTLTVFGADGRRLVEGDHPDCIQGWSRPKAPPMADVLIENNIAQGKMQGIFFGNHIRNGVDDGGFDRVVIRNNQVASMFANAIVLASARNSQVVGNTIETIPGAVNPKRPGAKIRANLRVTGEGNVVCGNKVADFPNHPGSSRCR